MSEPVEPSLTVKVAKALGVAFPIALLLIMTVAVVFYGFFWLLDIVVPDEINLPSE